MRFRLGLVTGLAAGYYLGARAGRQRYDQINRSVARMKRSETFEAATERARTVVTEGVGKARSLVDGGADKAADAVADAAADAGPAGRNGTRPGDPTTTLVVPGAAVADPTAEIIVPASTDLRTSADPTGSIDLTGSAGPTAEIVVPTSADPTGSTDLAGPGDGAGGYSSSR